MLTWMPDEFADAGLHVVPITGWETRGRNIDPKVVVAHHTATRPTTSDGAVCNLLVRGRPDLPGPLANVGLGRDGTVYLIAAGRANHAGSGGWQGITGNANTFGIEAFNDGIREPWPAVQLEAYDLLCATVLRKVGRTAAYLCAHREWAPGRKVDPQGIDMDGMRRRVQSLIDGSDGGEDDMWQYITIDRALVDQAFARGWAQGDPQYWIGKLGNLADPEWDGFRKAVTNGLIRSGGADHKHETGGPKPI